MGSIANNNATEQLKEVILTARKLCAHISGVSLLTEISIRRLYAILRGYNPTELEKWTLIALDQELKKRSDIEKKQFVMNIYVQEWNKKFGQESGRVNHAR